MNNRITALLALVLAAGLYFAYISPTMNGSIAETKAAIESDEQALVAAHAYAAKQDELLAKRTAIDSASLARLSTFLPDSVDNVGLILALNALAARSGLALSNIDVSANAANAAANTPAGQSVDPVSSIDLSLSAVGSYAAFQRFLEGIEQSQRILDVRNIVISGSPSGLYTYQMTVRIYWLR